MTAHTAGHALSSANLLACLGQALKFVVLVPNEKSGFSIVGALPDWFKNYISQASSRGGMLRLAGASPFLDQFLPDAHAHWNGDVDGAIESGVWAEQGASGGEATLDALALKQEESRYLIIRLLDTGTAIRRGPVQLARNALLDNEALEREVRRRTQQIREREEEVAMRLLTASGFRDQETGAHVRRIGLYSEAIAKLLGWDDERAEDMRYAAPMHDIGKIGIPDRILCKPGRLTVEEFETMKQHTVIGGLMLADTGVAMLELAREIAVSHHEQWQGAGYPYGLSGELIPLPARIVSIVDAYDALVHARVYKPAFPESEAISFLRGETSKRFDPQLVELFLDHLPIMREIRERVLDEPPKVDLNALTGVVSPAHGGD